MPRGKHLWFHRSDGNNRVPFGQLLWFGWFDGCIRDMCSWHFRNCFGVSVYGLSRGLRLCHSRALRCNRRMRCRAVLIATEQHVLKMYAWYVFFGIFERMLVLQPWDLSNCDGASCMHQLPHRLHLRNIRSFQRHCMPRWEFLRDNRTIHYFGNVSRRKIHGGLGNGMCNLPVWKLLLHIWSLSRDGRVRRRSVLGRCRYHVRELSFGLLLWFAWFDDSRHVRCRTICRKCSDCMLALLSEYVSS